MMIPVEKKSMIEIDRKNMLNKVLEDRLEKLVAKTAKLEPAQEQSRKGRSRRPRLHKTESSRA